MVLAKPRQQEPALECFSVFSVASSQNNQKVQTWKHYLQPAPMLGFCLSQSWFWNWCPHPLLLLGCLAQVWGVWIPCRGKETGLSQRIPSPWSSSVHGTGLQLLPSPQSVLLHCRSSLRCHFLLWLRGNVHVSVSGVKPSLTQQTLKYRLKPKPLLKWIKLGLELYFCMCFRFRGGYLNVKVSVNLLVGFPEGVLPMTLN